MGYHCESAVDGLLRALWIERAESKSPSKPPLILEELEDRVLLSASPLPVDVIEDAVDNADQAHEDAAPLTQSPFAQSPFAQSPGAETSLETAEFSAPLGSQPGSQLTPLSQATAAMAGDAVLRQELLEDAVAGLSATDAPPSANTRHEIVFINAGTVDADRLVEDLTGSSSDERQFEIVFLDQRMDGIQQIVEALQSHGEVQYDAIHLISHGSSTGVQIGGTWLTSERFATYATQIGQWQDAMSDNADLLIYGCDLASSTEGRALLDAFSASCDCDVAASVDDTGKASLGGDWDLEFEVGVIETSVALSSEAQIEFSGLLATVTVDIVADEFDGNTSSIANLIATPGGTGISLREAIVAANNTGGADNIHFNIAGAGPHSIAVGAGGFVDITEAVTIDGTTEPDFAGTPIIELNGTSAGSSSGLTIAAANTTVKGLVINRFSGNGIVLNADTATIQGNYIGTNVAGTSALANTDDGIDLNGSSGHQIGGTSAGEANIIAGNAAHGINIGGASSSVVIEGNFIGTDRGGTINLGNASQGIFVDSSAGNHRVGGTTAGTGNTIAFNGGRGIRLSSSTGNAFLRNDIHSNTGIGIDIDSGGVDTNDVGDGDSGANNVQNFPALTTATTDGVSAVDIAGTLNSTASTSFRVEFFASATADGTGFGEGERFLGNATIVTDGGGNATISESVSGVVAVGEFVTATATDPSNNTSEFSATVTAQATSLSGTVYSDEGTTPLGNQTVRIAVNGVDGGTAESNAANGVYLFSGLSLSGGDVVAVYLEDETADAVTVTIYNGSPMTLDLYQDFLIARKEDLTALTTSNLNTAQVAAESDVSNIYSVSASTLTVQNGKELLIPTGHQLNLGGSAIVHDLHIHGIFNAGGQSVQISGDLDNGGTFTTTGTVTFDGSSPSTIDTGGTGAGNDFQNLTIAKGTGSLDVVGNALDVDGILQVNSGSFRQGTGLAINAGTFNLATSGGFVGSDAAIDVASDVSLTSSGPFTSTTGTLTVSGSWTHTSVVFAHNNGTVVFNSNSSEAFNVSSVETFNNVTVNMSGTGGLEIQSTDVMRAVGTVNFTDGFRRRFRWHRRRPRQRCCGATLQRRQREIAV